MKELSIEEKARRYDRAIEKANSLLSDNQLGNAWIYKLLPELKESEDNIIIKALKSGFKMLEREYNLKGLGGIKFEKILTWLEKQGEEKPNPYSGTSFEYNGHTWGMCARDNGVEILIDGHLDRVFTIDSNAKEMFIKALERVEEQNAKGYKLTDCDKNSWWEDFKEYTTSEQILANSAKTCKDEQKPTEWSEEDRKIIIELIGIFESAVDGGHVAFPYRLIKDYIRVLKSCLPQTTWKPSDEQMRVLDLAIRCGINRGTTEETTLVSLFNDLKKLK